MFRMYIVRIVLQVRCIWCMWEGWTSFPSILPSWSKYLFFYFVNFFKFSFNWKIVTLQFVLVSAIQRESVISIHISPSCWTSLSPPHPTPQAVSSTRLSSLCYTGTSLAIYFTYVYLSLKGLQTSFSISILDFLYFLSGESFEPMCKPSLFYISRGFYLCPWPGHFKLWAIIPLQIFCCVQRLLLFTVLYFNLKNFL